MHHSFKAHRHAVFHSEGLKWKMNHKEKVLGPQEKNIRLLQAGKQWSSDTWTNVILMKATETVKVERGLWKCNFADLSWKNLEDDRDCEWKSVSIDTNLRVGLFQPAFKNASENFWQADFYKDSLTEFFPHNPMVGGQWMTESSPLQKSKLKTWRILGLSVWRPCDLSSRCNSGWATLLPDKSYSKAVMLLGVVVRQTLEDAEKVLQYAEMHGDGAIWTSELFHRQRAKSVSEESLYSGT